MPETSDRQLAHKPAIELLLWDSQHFGRKMGCLPSRPGLTAQTRSEEEAGLRIRAAIQRARDEQYQFLMARADPREIGRIHALEASGFRLMDTLVTWELVFHNDPPPSAVLPQGVTIRKAQPKDVPTLMDMARRAFADREVWLDRFHADPRIPRERADELYAQWVKNSILEPTPPSVRMAEIVWVAEAEGCLAGFLTAYAIGALEPFGMIPLNAVDQPYRRRKIYRALAETAVRWFCVKRKCCLVRIRTSATSYGVHNTWQRLGATMVGVEHTFHWWA